MPIVNINVVTADFFATGTGPGPGGGIGLGNPLTVSTGSDFTDNRGTITVDDGPALGVGGAPPDNLLHDSGDTDQVLQADVTIGSFSFDAGDFVQSESQWPVTYADGSVGRIIALKIIDDPGGGGNSNGFFIILRNDPVTGETKFFTPAPGEAITVGARNGNGNTSYDDLVCLSGDTLVSLQGGTCRVRDLKVGAKVKTMDSPYATLRWMFRRPLDARELLGNPKLRPIRITAGSLGSNLPKRDLLVSRQHRMLVSSVIAERMFGNAEVLVAAIKLTELPGVFIDDSVDEIEYFHLVFDQHELIFAEGAPTESLLFAPCTWNVLSEEAREELYSLFPELADSKYSPQSIRLIPKNSRQKKLVSRHVSNKKPLLNAHWTSSELLKPLRNVR